MYTLREENMKGIHDALKCWERRNLIRIRVDRWNNDAACMSNVLYTPQAVRKLCYFMGLRNVDACLGSICVGVMICFGITDLF